MEQQTYTELLLEAPAAAEDLLTYLLFESGATAVEVDDPAIIAAHLQAGDWDASVFDGQHITVGRITLRAYVAADFDAAALQQRIDALWAGEKIVLRHSAAPARDWLAVWREHFPVLRLGRRVIVAPAWAAPAVAANEVLLRISPGMAFGTGDHATTALCLELLEQALRPGAALLDIGCGSGILAIAALKLGAGRALAVDNDPLCKASVAEHCALNNIAATALPLLIGDILREPALQRQAACFAADIVVSNIVSGVIIALAALMQSYLRPGGLWLASGILYEKEAQVRTALESQGWRCEQRLQREGWLALALRRQTEAVR